MKNKISLILLSMVFTFGVGAADYYVDAVNGRDTNDGLARDSAKKTLMSAMAIEGLTSGDIVWAAPGVYNEGTSLNGENRVSVPTGVGLSSLEGAELTIIEGAPDPSTGGIGELAIRPVYLNKNAWVRGFTIRGGYTKDGANNANNGGGVLGVSDSAIVECIVTNNACGNRGTAVSDVSVFRSYLEQGKKGSFTANTGLYYCNTVVDSKSENRAIYSNGTVLNCTIINGLIMSVTQTDPDLRKPVYNSYIPNVGKYRLYDHCIFAHTEEKCSNVSTYENCRFGVSLNVDDAFRPSEKTNPLVDAGDRALYDATFPATWRQFKEPYDYANGWRMCGETIDIGAGEFQEARGGETGTLFSLHGMRARPDRPVALIGTAERTQLYKMYLCDPEKLTVVEKNLPEALPVSDYSQYAAIIIDCATSATIADEASWNTPARIMQVRAYLQEGGVIILAGKTVDLFAGMSDEAWMLVHSEKVTCLSPSLYQLRYDYRNVSLGEADEQGNWIPSAAGERVEALQKEYANKLKAIAGIMPSTEEREWDTIALGEAGTQTSSPIFSKSLNLRTTAPTYDEGLVLYDQAAGTKAKIYYDGEVGPTGLKNPALAQELAWHLKEMTGEDFEVAQSATVPTEGPAIYFQYRENEPIGASVFVQENSTLILGGNNAGVSHALTYLLEALGCRYLWPGATGKVIPRRQTHLAAPAVSFTKTPTIKKRTLRGTAATEFIDHVGNRNYYQWHGSKDVNDQTWAAGHSFQDYYSRFSQTNPEWFGMQPNGSREQDLGSLTERPTLCLSSAALAAQKAQDIKDSIAASKQKGKMGDLSFSNCLPDGNGRTTQCLCKNCRLLDPVNAPLVSLSLYIPFTQTISYPSLSDRMIHFQNLIARDVLATYPNRQFSIYVYSMYQTFPMRELPDPSLVLWMVNGDYTSNAAAESFRGEMAKWVNACPTNTWLWRPNALITYRVLAPKNLARVFFNDLSLFKANGVAGYDFDNYFDNYASMGLMYYAISKAALNFDEVDYDVIFNDFCEKGFGPAASPIKEYYAHQEAVYNAAANEASNNEYYYVLNLDLDYLQGRLDAARKLAQGNSEILARIAFLEHVMAYARPEHELANLRLHEGASSSVYKNRLKKFFEEELPTISEDPLVVPHDMIRSTSPARYFYFTGSY